MISADEPAHDAGFTLVETVVCVALLVAACVAALQVLPALAHFSQRDVLRDAAMALARTEIDRIGAATAYLPASGFTSDHSYALNAATTFGAVAHVHRSYCGTTSVTSDIAMTVDVTYAVASDTATVTVSYPRAACDPTVTDRVVLVAQLGPSALVPGTRIALPVGDPAQQ